MSTTKKFPILILNTRIPITPLVTNANREFCYVFD